MSKGKPLADAIANKADLIVTKSRPLANIAVERGQNLANRIIQEPRVAKSWESTKDGARRVGTWVESMRAGYPATATA